MSTLKTNTIKNTDDVEMYLAKAWVNFNGTGTVAIRAAGNVSSITDNGTGDYTVNFTISMPDANYSVVACGASNVTISTDINNTYNAAPIDASSVRLKCRNAYGNTQENPGFYSVAVFR